LRDIRREYGKGFQSVIKSEQILCRPQPQEACVAVSTKHHTWCSDCFWFAPRVPLFAVSSSCGQEEMPTRTVWREEMMHRCDILEPARARGGHANLLPWSQDVLASGCKGGCWRLCADELQDEVLAPLQKRTLARMMQEAHKSASSWAHASLRAAACPLEVRPTCLFCRRPAPKLPRVTRPGRSNACGGNWGVGCAVALALTLLRAT